MFKLNKQNIEGILGTIIFHMLILIIFMSIKLHNVKRSNEDKFVIIFEDNKLKELLQKTANEKILAGDNNETRKNIAVNTEQKNNKLSPEENLQRILQSMKSFNADAEKNLKEDNNIELNAELQQKLKDRSMIDSLKIIKEKKERKKADYFYKGPTNIYYTLKNRTHIFIAVPVYKCEGAGIVSVRIVVNQAGKVINASIDNSKTVSQDGCLRNVAVQYAYKTLFDNNSKAPEKQKGNITYHFVAQ